jgi:hypothetical protein
MRRYLNTYDLFYHEITFPVWTLCTRLSFSWGDIFLLGLRYRSIHFFELYVLGFELSFHLGKTEYVRRWSELTKKAKK